VCLGNLLDPPRRGRAGLAESQSVLCGGRVPREESFVVMKASPSKFLELHVLHIALGKSQLLSIMLNVDASYDNPVAK
jgi:hypothetical protein